MVIRVSKVYEARVHGARWLEDHPVPIPRRIRERLSRPSERTAPGLNRKWSPRRTDIRRVSRSRSDGPQKGETMSRDYMGVDWADTEHAIWVEDERGAKVTALTIPHTAVGLSEVGRWLYEGRAQGIEVWAAIERPEGRIVAFLLDHGVVVYPVNPKALDRARDRFRMSGAKSDPFDARVLATFLRTDHPHPRPPPPRPPRRGGGPGAQAPHAGLPALGPAAAPPGEPAHGDAEGILPSAARGAGPDDTPGPSLPAGLPDPGGPGRAHSQDVATVGAGAPAERGAQPRDVGDAEPAPAACARPRGAGQGEACRRVGGPTGPHPPRGTGGPGAR